MFSLWNTDDQYADSEDPDKPAHARSLIRVLAVRLKNKGYNPWSDCANVQDHPNLSYSYMQEKIFLRGTTRYSLASCRRQVPDDKL